MRERDAVGLLTLAIFVALRCAFVYPLRSLLVEAESGALRRGLIARVAQLHVGATLRFELHGLALTIADSQLDRALDTCLALGLRSSRFEIAG